MSSPASGAGRRRLRSSLAHAGLPFDEDGEFFCVARTTAAAARVLSVDRSPRPHTFELGRLLGYPPCCCYVAARYGEAELDDLDSRVGAWDFPFEYAVLDSGHYVDGHALISHIPCSVTCEPSRVLARRALAWLRENSPHEESRSPWPMWLAVLNDFGEREDRGR
jgi:hypothetical protein